MSFISWAGLMLLQLVGLTPLHSKSTLFLFYQVTELLLIIALQGMLDYTNWWRSLEQTQRVPTYLFWQVAGNTSMVNQLSLESQIDPW